EDRLRRLLREHLSPFTRRGEEDLYEQRVFEIDALGALRGRQGGASLDELPETGLPRFIDALDGFLLAERGQAELQKAVGSAGAALERVAEAALRRLDLLREPVEELKRRVAEVQP